MTQSITLRDISLNLLLGLVSGLIATILTLFIRSYWEKIIVPWYEERVYKDAHVEGVWEGQVTYQHGLVSDYVFQLNRKSHHIFGELVSKNSGDRYILEGEFRNLILTVTYSSVKSTDIDRGCFAFLLINNGRQLDGWGAFYYDDQSQVTAASVKLARK